MIVSSISVARLHRDEHLLVRSTVMVNTSTVRSDCMRVVRGRQRETKKQMDLKGTGKGKEREEKSKASGSASGGVNGALYYICHITLYLTFLF